MSWEDQFNGAKVQSSSAYMKKGNFFMRIDAIVKGQNRKFVTNFKLEGTVIHCIDGDNLIGQSVCDLYSESSDFFWPEVKRLISALSGELPENITPDDLKYMIGEDAPLKGMVVEYSAWEKPSKNGMIFAQKACKGMRSEAEYRAVASADEIERFLPTLVFAETE